MRREEYILLIINIEEDYKKLGHTNCPPFGDEKIWFNNYGLDHLFYKGRIPRTIEEVIKRSILLLQVPALLKNVRSIHSEEKRTKGKSIAYFWTIKEDGIRIILRRVNDGKLHFFSIMKE